MVVFWFWVSVVLLIISIFLFLWWLIKRSKHQSSHIKWWYSLISFVALVLSVVLLCVETVNSPEYIKDQLKIEGVKDTYTFKHGYNAKITGYTRPDATIKIYGADKFDKGHYIGSKKADKNGKFELTFSAFSYELVAHAKGYTDSKTVHVKDGTHRFDNYDPSDLHTVK